MLPQTFITTNPNTIFLPESYFRCLCNCNDKTTCTNLEFYDSMDLTSSFNSILNTNGLACEISGNDFRVFPIDTVNYLEHLNIQLPFLFSTNLYCAPKHHWTFSAKREDWSYSKTISFDPLDFFKSTKDLPILVQQDPEYILRITMFWRDSLWNFDIDRKEKVKNIWNRFKFEGFKVEIGTTNGVLKNF